MFIAVSNKVYQKLETTIQPITRYTKAQCKDNRRRRVEKLWYPLISFYSQSDNRLSLLVRWYE